MRVLVVEDDPVSALVLTRSLKSIDHPAVVAHDGAEAWHLLQSEDFRIVITDWMMPKVDGLELCRLIRSLANQNYIYVIMVAGRDSREDKFAAMAAGADDFLSKPFDPQELAARIAVAERVLEIQQQLAAKNTELEHLAKTISEREARFRALIEHSSDMVSIVTDEGAILYLSPSVTRVLGYSVEELVHQNGFSFLHPEDVDRVRIVFAHLRDSPGLSVSLETRARHKDGSWRYIESTFVNLSDKPEIGGIVIHSTDTTDRKQAVEKLGRAHAETEQLIASMSSILIGVDSKGEVTRWNAAAETVLGIAAREAVGKPFMECGIEWDWPPVLERMVGCLVADHQTRLDLIRYKRRDSKDGFLSLTVSPYSLDADLQPGLLVVGEDITERVILENQLSQAQKLESIGQLAAGIAHEINTPTQYIGDNTRFLQQSFKDLQAVLHKYSCLLSECKQGQVMPKLIADIEAAVKAADVEYLQEEVPRAIQQALEGVERVATIVGAMKEFSHPGTKEKVATDINKAIESTVTVARNEWKYVAELVTDFAPDLPLVPCFAGDFNQVILNILINAAHAIVDAKGKDGADKGMIRISTRCGADDWVEIRISDNGPGVPEAIRHKIFDPFFTTKQVGKGTGQGLAISHDVVVKKHGGKISFETEMGKGTTFVIQLPVVVSQESMNNENGAPAHATLFDEKQTQATEYA